MPMFITLGKLTDEGAKNIRSLPQGVKENMGRAERLGMKLHGWYLTQGRFDIVVIAEAPDAETVLAQTAAVMGMGNSRTETLRAFTLEEAERALEKVGAIGAAR
jgi:uncharacterized protein with GYD domain